MKQLITLATLLFVSFLVAKTVIFPAINAQQLFENFGYAVKTSLLNAVVFAVIYHWVTVRALLKKAVVSSAENHDEQLQLIHS